MITYISILRGINVGGQKSIKMDELRKMYECLKFEKVKTYIQSGNVIFSSRETSTKKLEEIISKHIKTWLGLDVSVFVLSEKELEKIIVNNPFANDKNKDEALLHVTFLTDQTTLFDKEKIIERKQENEEIEFGSNAVYLYCPGGYGRTKLNNNFLEGKLKVRTTTRNWKTTKALLKLANQS